MVKSFKKINAKDPDAQRIQDNVAQLAKDLAVQSAERDAAVDATVTSIDATVTSMASLVERIRQIVDGEVQGPGQVPIGGILAIANTAAWPPPATGVIKDGFMICDGAAIPAGGALTGNTPTLNDSRFIMGTAAAGTTGGSNTKNLRHTHTLSSAGGAEITMTRSTSGSVNLMHMGATGPSFTAAYRCTMNSSNTVNTSTYSSAALTGYTDLGASSTQDILPLYLTCIYVMRVE